MGLIYRSIVDAIEEAFEYGHRESSPDGENWTLELHSDWVKNIKPLWFAGNPLDRMRNVGVETTSERAHEFEQAIDEDPSGGYYYLAVAARGGNGDEALKWIMGALAAELNVRKLSMGAISRLMPASVLGHFVNLVGEGKIDRTFTKVIFSELISWEYTVGEDHLTRVDALVTEPRFKALDRSALEAMLDQIIASNLDQFEKAKENPKLIQWFTGQAMKASGGKASAPVVMEIMTERLAG